MNNKKPSGDVSKMLKKKGFREKAMYFYDKFGHDWHCIEPSNMNNTRNYSAPFISQVLKWLRDEKKIFVCIYFGYCGKYLFDLWEIKVNDSRGLGFLDIEYNSYEQAALAGIEYVLDKLI